MNTLLCENELDCRQDSEHARVERHVQNRLKGRVWNLRLLFREDGLILRGHARTFYVKQLAQHAVLETTELPLLANEIDVS